MAEASCGCNSDIPASAVVVIGPMKVNIPKMFSCEVFIKYEYKHNTVRLEMAFLKVSSIICFWNGVRGKCPNKRACDWLVPLVL